jgi:hypothetical protein
MKKMRIRGEMNNRGRGRERMSENGGRMKEKYKRKKIRIGERGRRDGIGRGQEMIKEERRGVEIMAKMGEKKDKKKRRRGKKRSFLIPLA